MTTITAAKETVLVIEDEPLFRIWLADTIEAAGYDVTTASTGDEGRLEVQLPPSGGAHSCDLGESAAKA